jgi:hypothetical protein
MLPALNGISSKQAKATEQTNKQCKMLLDYAATYPNAKLHYYTSDMQLQVDSDDAYLVLPQAKSRYAGFFYLGTPHSTKGKLNGAILVPCKSIRSVVASAAEAETGGLFHNGQEAIIIKTSLEALDHPQNRIPIKTDNSTATGFIYDNIRQRKSKTWDMRWNWLRDKSVQEILKYYWDAGKNNWADYFTKHHAPSHHLLMRPNYILHGHNVSNTNYGNILPPPSHVQGCVSPLTVRNGYHDRWPRQPFQNDQFRQFHKIQWIPLIY